MATHVRDQEDPSGLLRNASNSDDRRGNVPGVNSKITYSGLRYIDMAINTFYSFFSLCEAMSSAFAPSMRVGILLAKRGEYHVRRPGA